MCQLRFVLCTWTANQKVDEQMIDHMLDQLHNDAAHLRDLEDRQIGALASNCDPPNAVGWTTIECHECQAIETLKGSQRELAEHVYALKRWMIYHGEPLCYSCQNYS